MILWQLFITSVKIGMFSFGGGYAMLPLIESEVVGKGWMTQPEFIDMVAISQMTPGPIAINSCTFVGYKMAGITGALAASTGMILPPFIFISIVAMLWMRFAEARVVKSIFQILRPVTVGLIASAALILARVSLINIPSIIMFLLALAAMLKTKINPIWLIIAGGIVGIIFKM